MQASIVQWWMPVQLANDQKVLQSAWISLKAWNETLLVFRLEILSWIETLTFKSWLVLARYASLVMVCEGWSN